MDVSEYARKKYDHQIDVYSPVLHYFLVFAHLNNQNILLDLGIWLRRDRGSNKRHMEYKYKLNL
jgi:hypothetical protein